MTTTGRCKPTAGALRPGQAVETGRDGLWRAPPAPPPDTEAGRAKLETRARAARRQKKLEKEGAASLHWAVLLWAAAGFTWVALVSLVYKAAKGNLSFTFALAAAAAVLSNAQATLFIPVYDCEHPATTYRAINLHEPNDCPDPETDYLDP